MNSLIFDIGSEGVGAMRGASVIEREKVAFSDVLEPRSFFAATRAALRTLCDRLVRLYGRDVAYVDAMHIFLRSPWVVSKTRAVRVDFPSPTRITNEVLVQTVRDAEKDIEENFRAAYAEVAGSVRAVEKKITEFRVNGYIVPRAVGQTAQTLELTLLESFVPENAIFAFTGTVGSVSHVPRVWHSGAAACGLSLVAHAGEFAADTLTIVAGAEATELVIVRGGLLREVTSIPQGIRTLARMLYHEDIFHSARAAEAFLSAPESALTSLAPARRARVERARAAGAERLAHAVSEALAPRTKSGFAPVETTLLAPEEYRFFFFSALASLHPVSHVPSADPFLSAESAFLSAFA